jgi:DNA-binding PadR family transcriptional regulator
MSSAESRDLTTLEYLVLGLIGMEPQTGYSIIGWFEVTASIRWSASPGSVYPILKRLEKAGYLDGELESVHDTRARRIYSLTAQGEETLDAWIRLAPSNQDIAEERDVIMSRFLFAEKRLSRAEVLDWLDRYLAGIDRYESMLRAQRPPEDIAWSAHQILVLEMAFMELSLQRNWVFMARNRLEIERLRDARATSATDATP